MSKLSRIDRRTGGNSVQNYRLANAVIKITDLRLRTFIGFNEDELEKKQDIVINAHIEFDASRPCQSDNESETLDYKVITKKMINHVENGRFRLIEKLNADLVDIIMSYGDTLKTTVTIDKPHALRFADSVSVTLSASRQAS